MKSESKSKREETFCEMVRMKRLQDISAYVKGDGPAVDYTAPVRGLYRAKLRERGGHLEVTWEFLASFNARIIGTEADKWGREISVIAGRGADDSSFVAKVPSLILYSDKSAHNKAVYGALLNARNFATSGSFVFPSCLAATVRAIIALSAEGEPMPPPLALDDPKTPGPPPGAEVDKRDEFWNQ